MRNMLDDLTRPAAPAGLALQTVGGRLRVSVAPSPDPRVLGFAASVRVGNRWLRLCHGVVSCTGTPPAGKGAATIGAVAIDAWRRHSAATFGVSLGH